MSLKKKLLFVLVLTIILPVLIVVAAVNKDRSLIIDGKEMVRLENYNHIESGEVTCMALMPECGYCPGVALDKNCFVEKSRANKYR